MRATPLSCLSHPPTHHPRNGEKEEKRVGLNNARRKENQQQNQASQPADRRHKKEVAEFHVSSLRLADWAGLMRTDETSQRSLPTSSSSSNHPLNFRNAT